MLQPPSLDGLDFDLLSCFQDLWYLGLRQDDPRLKETIQAFTRVQKNMEQDNGEALLDRETFKKCF